MKSKVLAKFRFKSCKFNSEKQITLLSFLYVEAGCQNKKYAQSYYPY